MIMMINSLYIIINSNNAIQDFTPPQYDEWSSAFYGNLNSYFQQIKAANITLQATAGPGILGYHDIDFFYKH